MMGTLKRHPLAFFGAVLFIAMAVTAGFVLAPSASGQPGSTYGYLKLFSEVLTLVRHNYVENVSSDELLRGAYQGLLSSLDGESEYVTAAQYAALRREKASDERKAKAGIYLIRHADVLRVAAVLPGSDAEARKLRLGDQVRRIGDRPGRGMGLSEAYRLLKGSDGSTVKLSISRREEPRREDVEVKLQDLELPLPALDSTEEGISVVTIPAFGPGSADALSEIFGRLQATGVDRVILDLRGNAWGSPEEAAQAASLLAGAGVMARIVERGGTEREIHGEGPRTGWQGEALILTDPGTAFAAEVFTAALLDKGIVRHGGESTLGRGGEKEILPLANGDFLLLTVREYVSPSGTGWHGDGLKPDVSIPYDRRVPFEERASTQLRKAVEWMLELQAEPKAA